jgi:hypothetical protein
MRRFGCLLAVFFALASLSMAGTADAVPILVGDSNSSTFSNFGCYSCPGSSLTSSSVILASTASGGSDSVLSIVNTNFSASGSVSGLTLAELSLLIGQKPGVGQFVDAAGNPGVKFNYNLVLTFTTPSGSQSQTFSLGLSGDGGPGANADVFVSGLSPLSLTDPLVMGGVTLSNFRFATDASDLDSVFSNGTWDGSAQKETHFLYLLADVTATTTGGGQLSVPEPSTLLLFGTGLIALTGFGSLRRKAKPS